MMKNYFDLKGQVAVVTGASAGLGLQMAKAFANQGANLVLLARRQNLLEENARAISQEYGVEVLPIVCDITVTEQVQNAVKKTMEHFGRVDILLNNAGTGAVGPAEEITDEQLKHEIDIDLFGTYICAREFGKEMINAQYGRIINIASIYGLVGNMIIGSAPYHAAKGGVVNLTRALAAEWGKYGITVNSICPGFFYTELTTATLDSDFFQDVAKRSIPLGRYGKSGELDTCALFLASPNSTYVNGQNIAIDGGYTAV
ncbi:MAG: SDR family oxidoreductase [Bacteroidaceae bacterium]|nr:SDR family oxidoreductase [Bacteroidaceae bacterium]MBR3951287.1 SDR family oxidoreductase [Bacteroidaceae bacterium]